MNDITAINRFTDKEICILVRYRSSPTGMNPLVEELVRRLEAAVELIEDTDRNLRALQAKYGITDTDLIECNIVGPEFIPPPFDESHELTVAELVTLLRAQPQHCVVTMEGYGGYGMANRVEHDKAAGTVDILRPRGCY